MNRSEKFSPNSLSSEEMTRLAHIEGREDLFETKLLNIVPPREFTATDRETAPPFTVLAVSRGPGSGQAVSPVMERLQVAGAGLMALTDGRAEELIKKRFSIEDITPERSVLDAATPASKADVILTDSSTEERALEIFTSGTLNEKPTVLIEDYYTASHGYLQSLIDRKLPLPVKICVMDAAAKELLEKKFPNLADRVIITGQPAFDRFTHVDTATEEARVKERLGIPENGKLISFMSTFISPEAVEVIATAVSKVPGDVYLAFRKHPRDNTSADEYEKRFAAAGVKSVDTSEFSTDEVMASSDVILTTWSTAGIEGMYLGKPTVHVYDPKLVQYPETLPYPIPPVRLGASAGVDDVRTLPATLSELLDPNSQTYRDQLERMQLHYPADGNNAERVAAAIQQSLTNK